MSEAVGRVALVTGGTSGIGFALVEQLLLAGWHVVVVARQLAVLDALRERYPGRLTALYADLSQAEQVEALGKRLAAMSPPISLAIMNAGVQYNYCVGTTGHAEHLWLEEELAVNLGAPLRLTRHLLPRLLAQRSASLVYLTSGLALVSKPRAAVYCATKAGLRAYIQSLRWQVQSRLQLMEVLLPLVDTPMSAGRGNNKLSAWAAAEAILRGLQQRKTELYVGKVRLLYWVNRAWPALAARIMRDAQHQPSQPHG